MAPSALSDVQAPADLSLDSTKQAASNYWWLTSGSDIAHMMQEAGYADEIARQFLTYFRETICSHLGDAVTPTSKKSGLGWDGSPFEYSFELKSNGAAQSVRFAVDVANLKTYSNEADAPGVLDIANTREVVKTLNGKTINFDDTWYSSLVEFFDQSSQPKEKQAELAAQVGHQTPICIGFDLQQKGSPAPGILPVMGKVYFTPCHRAAADGKTRWDTIYQAISQLPGVSTQHSSLIKSLDMIGEYLATKPESWKDGARYLATDFVSPDKARLKIYMRYPGNNFDEIWDFFTLGGRIPYPDEDKQLYKDLMALTGPGSINDGYTVNSDLDYTNFRRKMTCIYFSLSVKNSTPAAKIGIYPPNFAPNDGVIARGLDAWLEKYNWPVSKSVEKQLKNVFSHRSLDEKKGLFTFISIGRKEDPTKKDLSMQVYLAPELYSTPRDV